MHLTRPGSVIAAKDGLFGQTADSLVPTVFHEPWWLDIHGDVSDERSIGLYAGFVTSPRHGAARSVRFWLRRRGRRGLGLHTSTFGV